MRRGSADFSFDAARLLGSELKETDFMFWGSSSGFLKEGFADQKCGFLEKVGESSIV
jgi:hypothetical protein